ncbi:MAG TPA: CPBP family intramembrane glutamic endopeptidase [Abditibacterium sp.]|jgi:membrane protease YdiL (CAAX protease family)
MPEPTSSEAPFEGSTWEDDETRATGVLRALCTLLAAGFLAYAQWKAPANWPGPIGQNWGRWVWTSVVCNLALPVGIIWMFFGQGLTFQDWLRDQKHIAWNYGWNTTFNWHELHFTRGKRNFSFLVILLKWENRSRHLKISLGCWLVFLPFLIYFSRQSEMRAAYAAYLPPATNFREWAFLLGTLVVYMFCWEWFFRGFSLFGIAQGLGPIVAIGLQAALFGLAHTGKPQIEMWSAFGGGLVLGTLSWREKSFFPAFLIHALIHVSWAILVLI